MARPKREGPAAASGEAQKLSRIDAVPHTGNQPSAQSNPAARSAAFILDEATALGIRIATDGDELIMLVPLRVPRETRRWFEIQLHEFRAEVVNIILRKNAARTGVVS